MNIQEMNNNEFVEWLKTIEPDTNALVKEKNYIDRLFCCFKRAIELQLADTEPLTFHNEKLQEFFNKHKGQAVDVLDLDQEGLAQEFQEIYLRGAPVEAQNQEGLAPEAEEAYLRNTPTTETTISGGGCGVPTSSLVQEAKKVRLYEKALELKQLQALAKNYKEVYQALCRETSSKEAKLASRILLSKIVGARVVDFQYSTFDFLLRMTVEHQSRKLPDRQRYIDMVETLLKKGK
jgi:hypothetical protein